MNRKSTLLGKELRNQGDPRPFMPGMSLQNANGDVDPTSLGYQYTLQTTTQIRAKTIEQKFYRVPPADFMPVIVGTGAWMEDIKTNLTYDVAGPFEQGIIGQATGPSRLAQVDVGMNSKNAKIITWAKGYQYTTPEISKALASNNWDVVASKMAAAKRNWDLGIQALAFLGLKGQAATVPGLLTNADVNVDTTTIDENISAMDSTDFQAFVANVLDVFFENSNGTVLPNMFVMPMADYLGLGSAAAAGFPVNTKLEYLLNVFRLMTQNPGFEIRGLAYCDLARNAGFVSTNGKNRYVLYNKEADTLAMDIPVDFFLSPAATANNFQWDGVGAGQFTGCIVYRPAEVMYFDHD